MSKPERNDELLYHFNAWRERAPCHDPLKCQECREIRSLIKRADAHDRLVGVSKEIARADWFSYKHPPSGGHIDMYCVNMKDFQRFKDALAEIEEGGT